jgi:hypothetical protein
MKEHDCMERRDWRSGDAAAARLSRSLAGIAGRAQALLGGPNHAAGGHSSGNRESAPNSSRDQRRPSLTALAKKHGTDKWGTRHRYTPHYAATLRHLRRDTFTLLEIGIGGYSKAGAGGASLRMWKDFFPNATIVGLDIHDKSFVEEERICVYQGDQTDPGVLREIVKRHPDLRVVIDDGSHVSAHVIASFNVLFPLLPSGGVYAIEDLQTSYWPEYGGQIDPDARGTSMDMVKRLVDGLNYEEFRIEGYEPRYTDRHVVAVHAWHNLVVIEKGVNRRRPLQVERPVAST